MRVAKKVCMSVVLLLSVLLLGCRGRSVSYFDYQGKSFCAEIRGEMRGVGFCAVLTVEEGEGGRRGSIQYSEPVELGGLEVSVLFDEKGAPTGNAKLSIGGKESAVHDPELLAGLLQPLELLLCEYEPESVKKTTDGGFLLRLPAGREMTLSTDGFPSFFRSPEGSFLLIRR